MGQVAICNQCNAPADTANKKLKSNKLTQNYQINADLANGEADFYEKNEQKASNLKQLTNLDNKEKITQLDFSCSEIYGSHLDVVEESLLEMKSIRILKFDFPWGKLDNEGASRLATMLESCRDVMPKINSLSINLYHNQIKDSGMQELAVQIGKFSTLKHLELRITHNDFNELGGIAIGECILNLSKLTHVHIDLRDTKIGSSSTLKISESLRQLSKLVNIELKFADGNQQKEQVQNVFENLAHFKVCEKLHIEYKVHGLDDPSEFRKQNETILKKNPFCAKNLRVTVIL